MEHQISRKTMNIFTAVNFLKASDHIGNTVYKRDGDNGYNFGLCMTRDTFCDVGEYGDFITDLSNYAGKKYYRKYLKSTRTPLEPKFEHGEELRLEHTKDLVVYIADCTAYEGFCIVLIDNTPERVNNLYLSRPETAEQKAAKERAKAIVEMDNIVNFDGADATDKIVAEHCCETLYDAGYRK